MHENAINQVDSMNVANDTTYGISFFVYWNIPRHPNYWFFDTTGWDGYPLRDLDSLTFTAAPPPPQLIDDSSNANVEWFNTVPYSSNSDTQYVMTNCAVWHGNRIYCSPPLIYIDLDDSLHMISDSVLFYNYGPKVLRLNDSGTRLLSVSGWLEEIKLDSNIREVIDSSQYNSGAVYVPNSNNIIYYTYGSYSDTNMYPMDAGYYLFDRATGQRTLLLHHITSLGPNEIVNGFDISPDGTKLLIPSCDYYRMPRIFEYDLTTHMSDTLQVPFNTSNQRWLLWLRYNHDGSKILYSSYPVGPANDSSEVGIIDRATLAKQVLTVNPNTLYPWVCVFPEWSPDDTQIVFTAGTLDYEPPGSVEIYGLGFLKTLR